MSVCRRVLCATALLFAMTADALAYGGPGAAITLIGSLVGVGLAILASVFYVIVWPIRRMMKKRRAKPAETQPGAAAALSGPDTAAGTAAAEGNAAGTAAQPADKG